MPEMINKVLNFASILDEGTLEQAQKTAELPFVWPHMALMPDAHVGFGATVGSVIPTIGAIIPNAVGVDIGCGMAAIRTQFTSQSLPDSLGPIHGKIREAVPAGVGEGHESFKAHRILHKLGSPVTPLSEKQVNTALRQMGTLGAGNHFVELCLDTEDRLWLVLHSGSRGIGNQLARHHTEIAKAIAKRYFIPLPDWDLAYLVEGTQEFSDYWHDLQWAQNYARENRNQMVAAVLDVLRDSIGPVQPEIEVNCHHNYSNREHHNGKNILVTRKGAISARDGELGIIPGSMGDLSFIVRGLGNAGSFCSAPHGAGRSLSRGSAKRLLDVDSLRAHMAGKVWNDRDAESLVDEHPEAYKPIATVMEDAATLVEPVFELTQILNYKGL